MICPRPWVPLPPSYLIPHTLPRGAPHPQSPLCLKNSWKVEFLNPRALAGVKHVGRGVPPRDAQGPIKIRGGSGPPPGKEVIALKQ